MLNQLIPTDQIATNLIAIGLLLAVAILAFAAGRIYASNRLHDDLKAEYKRGKRDGYAEGRKVEELGKKTPPIMGQGYTSNRAKRSGH